MANGDIPNENIQTSSKRIQRTSNDNLYGFPSQARLNGSSTWTGINSTAQPWIQADIGYQTYISGVVTQGDGGVGGNNGDHRDWVTSIKVSTFYMSINDTEVFMRNGFNDSKPTVSTPGGRHSPCDMDIMPDRKKMLVCVCMC